jgi:hypothetical protein
MVKYNPTKPLFSLHIPKTAGTSFENVLRNWFNKHDFPNINNHPRLLKIFSPINFDFFCQRLLGCGLYLHYSHEYLQRPPRAVPLGLHYGVLNRSSRPECVHGHFDPDIDGGNLFDFYPKAEQFITFLRDPLEMQLSIFFYMKKMIETGSLYWQGEKVTSMKYDGDIDRWVEERPSYMLHFLPMKFDELNYKDVIEKYFIHIGVTEAMQNSVDILADKLNFRSLVVPSENVTSRTKKPSPNAVKKFMEKHKLEYLIYHHAQSLNL